MCSWLLPSHFSKLFSAHISIIFPSFATVRLFFFFVIVTNSSLCAFIVSVYFMWIYSSDVFWLVLVARVHCVIVIYSPNYILDNGRNIEAIIFWSKWMKIFRDCVYNRKMSFLSLVHMYQIKPPRCFFFLNALHSGYIVAVFSYPVCLPCNSELKQKFKVKTFSYLHFSRVIRSGGLVLSS